MTAAPASRGARRLRAGLALALAAASLQGCAKKPAPAPSAAEEASDPAQDARLVEDVRAGSAALTCGSKCEAAWNAARPKLKALYDAQDWRALAAGAARVGFQEDLGYFYLGRAAEELHAYDASIGYYRTAVHLSTEGEPAVRCRGGSDRCDGFLFPADVLTRLSIAMAEAERAKSLSYDRRRAPRYSAAPSRAGAARPDEPQPPAPAGPEPMIDPPPVAR